MYRNVYLLGLGVGEGEISAIHKHVRLSPQVKYTMSTTGKPVQCGDVSSTRRERIREGFFSDL